MKTPFPVARKTASTVRNWKNQRKLIKFLQQKKYTLIKAHGLYFTQNMNPLVVMTDLMKTLLPLLGTQKIEENGLTANFSDAFQQKQKNIWIKTSSFKLTQNLCTLVVINNFMETLISRIGTENIEENLLTPNFNNAIQQQKKMNKRARFEINQKSVWTSRDAGFDENFVSTTWKTVSTVSNWKNRRKLLNI